MCNYKYKYLIPLVIIRQDGEQHLKTTVESEGVCFYIQVDHSNQSHTLSHQETSPDLGMSLRLNFTASLVFFHLHIHKFTILR